MVESINTKMDLVANATSFASLSEYGKIMIGDKGFEFFNDRDVNKFIQIPWEEIDCVIVSVMFGGKWIPRFAIKTKKNGTFTFSAKDPKRVLRGIRKYIHADKIVKSRNLFQILWRSIGSMSKKTKKNH